MATKWKDLKHKASPETRERVKREALAEYAEMERIGVGVIRVARQQTQVAVAEQMHVPPKRRFPARKPVRLPAQHPAQVCRGAGWNARDAGRLPRWGG